MALGFIKKVFTFGKEKPAEVPGPPAELTAEEKAAISAESEPKGRDEDLPVAEDPVLAEEMETAGGPADDLSPDDLSMVPLELLEAEAEEEAEDASVQEIPASEAAPEEEPAAVTASATEPVVPVLPKGFATAEARAPEPEAPAPTEKLSWFQRLKAGLFRTSSQLTGQISALFTKRKLDDETLEELEDLLIQADLGVETALRVTDTLASERYGKDVTGDRKSVV